MARVGKRDQKLKIQTGKEIFMLIITGQTRIGVWLLSQDQKILGVA